MEYESPLFGLGKHCNVLHFREVEQQSSTTYEPNGAICSKRTTQFCYAEVYLLGIRKLKRRRWRDQVQDTWKMNMKCKQKIQQTNSFVFNFSEFFLKKFELFLLFTLLFLQIKFINTFFVFQLHLLYTFIIVNITMYFINQFKPLLYTLINFLLLLFFRFLIDTRIKYYLVNFLRVRT